MVLFHHRQNRTDEALGDLIHTGLPAAAMPPSDVKGQDLTDLIRFVRSITVRPLGPGGRGGRGRRAGETSDWNRNGHNARITGLSRRNA